MVGLLMKETVNHKQPGRRWFFQNLDVPFLDPRGASRVLACLGKPSKGCGLPRAGCWGGSKGDSEGIRIGKGRSREDFASLASGELTVLSFTLQGLFALLGDVPARVWNQYVPMSRIFLAV